MLLDRALPDFDVTQVRHIVVEASPEATFEAVRAWDPAGMQSPAVRWLTWLRALPEHIGRGSRGGSAPAHTDEAEGATGLERMAQWGWIPLGEEPCRELVAGLVGQFWKPVIEPLHIEAGEFAAFDEPGYAKLAVSFSVRPYGAERTLLTYEVRTATTDATARRWFRWYWRVIGPFAGLLMGLGLRDIRAMARAADGR